MKDNNQDNNNIKKEEKKDNTHPQAQEAKNRTKVVKNELNNNKRNKNEINNKEINNKIINNKENNDKRINDKIIKKDNKVNDKKVNNQKNDNNINNNINTNEIKKEEVNHNHNPNNKSGNNIDFMKKEKSPTKILSSVVTTGKEKINDLYLKKVNDLSNIYAFSSNYLSFISQVFKKLCEPFYSKLSSSYINNVKPYLKYFKELVNILISFSDKLNNLNSSIEEKKDDNEEESLIRVENNLNSAVKKLNIIFADTSSVIAKNLKENIINKPLFAKFETIEGKFEENFHKMLNLISQLEQFRIKFDNEYNKKYLNIFNTFIQKYNELDNYLIQMKDFFIIEYDIINAANKAMRRVTKFIEDIKKLFEDSTNIFCDYLEMLKIMIKIYYEENKKIILPNVLTEKMINDLEKLIGQDIRKNIEKKFCIKNIIEHYQDEALRNEINHLLLKYQDILGQYKILKGDEINNISHFNIKHFKSTEIFFKFLLSLIPPTFQVNYDDVIQFKTDVKRDCGLFKGWKECHMIISYQGHILFFDEEPFPKTEERSESGNFNIVNDNNKTVNNNIENNNNNNNEINNRKSLGLSEIVNNKNIEKNNDNIIGQLKESKFGEDFKKEEIKYGIVPDKLSIMYYKNSYGIRKKEKKQGKYLFEIWEKAIGNKKNKINVIDALDQKNLENILLELTETNIYDV